MATCAQRSCVITVLGDTQSCTEHSPKPPALIGPALSRAGVGGLKDPFLPTLGLWCNFTCNFL